MATMTAMPASALSMMASAQKRGGTKTWTALAPVASTASETVSKMGRPLGSLVPPLPWGGAADHAGCRV